MFDEEIVAVDRATQIVIHTQSGFKTFEGCVEDVIDYGEQAVEAYKQSLIENLIKEGYLKGDKLIPPDTTKKSHGTCCYCSDCGYLHDECVCEHNRLLSLIKGDSTKEE